MRRRMYFLLPDVKRARTVYKELLLARIDAKHIHVLAKEGTPLRDLPEATVLQKSDAVHGAGLGLLAGAVTGAVAGGLILLFPPTGLAMSLGIVLIMALLGATMGVWVAGIIGSSTPNTHLEAFGEEIEGGKVLLIVDVPRDRIEEISRLVRRHPEADARGIDPTVPSPFP
ncbi:MAG TPA: DUF1269 domain-containing protein [Burkholderiales bacterium]